jgi:pilus assembly protein CpaB
MRMRRLVLALVIAVAISGVFTLWVSRKIGKIGVSQGGSLRYVAAAHLIEAGQVLKSEDLKEISWPNSDPLDGVYDHLSDVIGRTALYPLSPGEPIQDDQLAAAGSGMGLSAEIPHGMRALSLRSDEIVGVAGFLFPGTHVDVLVTYVSQNSPAPVTSIVLQDVEVLAVGQRMEPDPKGKPLPVGVVTLLVSPGDAEKAVLASAQGKVQFVLRNSSDAAQVSTPSVQMAELGQASVKESAVKAKNAMPSAGAPTETYSVQIVAGDKTTTENFR